MEATVYVGEKNQTKGGVPLSCAKAQIAELRKGLIALYLEIDPRIANEIVRLSEAVIEEMQAAVYDLHEPCGRCSLPPHKCECTGGWRDPREGREEVR